jgi:hypothetical protein
MHKPTAFALAVMATIYCLDRAEQLFVDIAVTPACCSDAVLTVLVATVPLQCRKQSLLQNLQLHLVSYRNKNRQVANTALVLVEGSSALLTLSDNCWSGSVIAVAMEIRHLASSWQMTQAGKTYPAIKSRN